MTTKLFVKKLAICLFTICALYGLSSCHKKYDNPAPKSTPPVATAKWTKLNAPNKGINVLELVNNTIYAGIGNNLYISNDEGATWTSSEIGKPGLADVTAIKVFNNIVYAGTNASGVFSSSDGGKTWTNNGPFFNTGVTSFAERNNNLYAATDGDGVMILNQASAKWEPFNNNLPQIITSYTVFKIVNTNNTLVAAAGVNSTFYHYDFTNNQWVESALPKLGSYLVDAIYDNGAIIGIGTERKIIRSVNNGIDWTYDTKDLQETLPGALNNEKIYAGSLKYYVLINTIQGGWVQQRDKTAAVGSSWANGQELLSKIQLHGIVELDNKLFLATDSGLYVKKL
ncbi:sialidase family protein [Mucilaginibacter sp.]|uniref:WD40/YVTN/BNR-like repeat-containing protein n=1 Tax=Mucilaginibacter sp. TaxID=1882438 RepID=UPI0025CDCA89|nr:sialidase family protein [Mucilaginibacter sp.]